MISSVSTRFLNSSWQDCKGKVPWYQQMLETGRDSVHFNSTAWPVSKFNIRPKGFKTVTVSSVIFFYFVNKFSLTKTYYFLKISRYLSFYFYFSYKILSKVMKWCTTILKFYSLEFFYWVFLHCLFRWTGNGMWRWLCELDVLIVWVWNVLIKILKFFKVEVVVAFHEMFLFLSEI